MKITVLKIEITSTVNSTGFVLNKDKGCSFLKESISAVFIKAPVNKESLFLCLFLFGINIISNIACFKLE